MAKPIFLHVGLQKTATTTLQAAWKAHPEVAMPVPYRDIIRTFGFPSPSPVDPAMFWKTHGAGFREAEAQQKTTLLSHEGLAGVFLWGGAGRTETAARLAATFDDAQVMLTLREPGAWLASIYNQYVRSGGRWDLPRFFQGMTHLPDHHLGPAACDWPSLVETYQEKFGRSNVHVLFYEDLRREPEAFLGQLSSIMGVGPIEVPELPRNPSLSDETLRIMRSANRFLRPKQARAVGYGRLPGREKLIKMLRSIDRTTGSQPRRVVTEAKQLVAAHVPSMAGRLTALTGRDVASLGYR